jgi:phosphatidylglycerol---prolipoprotein diacylglyceryl transferase
MYPSIITNLPSYGTMILIGIFFGIFLFRRGSSRMNLDIEYYTDIVIWVALGGFFGARLLQVIVDYNIYFTSLSGIYSIFKLWKGGFAYLGGFLMGLSILWILKKRYNLPNMLDLIAIPLAFTHGTGRIGCLMSGCCWGKETSTQLGLNFPPKSAVFEHYLANGGLTSSATSIGPFHPTQLYEALGNFLIVTFLVLWSKRQRFHGHLTAMYLITYGFLRFIVEIFRGDPSRGYPLKINTPNLNNFLRFSPESIVFLSTSQLLSLLLIGSGLLILWLKRKSLKSGGFSS